MKGTIGASPVTGSQVGREAVDGSVGSRELRPAAHHKEFRKGNP